MGCSSTTKKRLVFGIGGFLFLVGIIVGSCWGLIFDSILSDQLGLTKTSTSHELWVETPIPMYIDFYLFNWTNSDEFMEPGRPADLKPIFSQMGPYVFTECHEKVDTTFNTNDTVTFRQIRTWHFDEERSGDNKLTDEVTNINVIAVTVAYMMRHEMDIVKVITDGLLNRVEEKPIITRTAGELLLDGYSDGILNITQEIHIPKFNIAMKKFGWFSERNGSAAYDGWFNMFTGTDDISKLGVMDQWNFQSAVPYYESPCADVTGTTGELWPPLPDDAVSVSVFSSDLCSTVTLMKEDKEIEVEGVPGLSFIGEANNFDNGSEFESQECYCKEPWCLTTPSGVRNVSLCRFNAPAFVSYPHFYLADPSYRDAIEGMEPDPKEHQFSMELEPVSGIPLSIHARIQINILLQNFQEYKFYRDMPTVFIPCMWFDQHTVMTEELASKAKAVLAIKPAGWGVMFTLAGVGAIMIIVGLYISVKKGWAGDDTGTLLDRSNKPATANK